MFVRVLARVLVCDYVCACLRACVFVCVQLGGCRGVLACAPERLCVCSFVCLVVWLLGLFLYNLFVCVWLRV